MTIVDDSSDNLRSYKQLLESSFKLELIQDPTLIFDFLSKASTDIIILDLHMPQMSGFTLFQKIRELYDFPVIFLSADPSEDVMIEGLSLGAEDFISKPVSIKELIARIKNKVLINGSKKNQSEIITFKDFELNCELQSVKLNNEDIQLTPLEYKLIHLFAKNPNRIYSKDSIAKLLWPNGDSCLQSIDTHLSNLRKKLHPFSSNLVTIKSRGYVLRI